MQAPAINQNPLLLDATLRPNAATPTHMIRMKIPCNPVNIRSDCETLRLNSGGIGTLLACFGILPPAQIRGFQIRSSADSGANRSLRV